MKLQGTGSTGNSAKTFAPFMPDRDAQWLCCQLGAREHYAVPRALQLGGLLREFMTDVWIRPKSLSQYWGNKLAGRFHPGLAGAQVTAPNAAALTFELKSQAMGLAGWELIDRRNEWFQRHVVAQLTRRHERDDQPLTVFAYSYAADRIFKFARERGWRKILGQIDPGPAEERIVARLNETLNGNGWKPAPPQYWAKWRTECDLADQIVVNSAWSREALLDEGVPAERIHVTPLAFETSAAAQSFQRNYPPAFSSERPLRVLFLGQINLRKGVRQLLDAARLLRGEPIEFWFVGPRQLNIDADLKANSRIKWFGVVPRASVDRYYREADVFILPTLSDGFGLTQLEAQSWKLPVIASRFCGEVVNDGINGVLLEEVSGDAIASLLLELLRAPERLIAMSQRSCVSDRFSLKTLSTTLSAL